MADAPQPILVFSMPGLTAADIALLNTNYDDVHNAVPTDLISAFTSAHLTLTANVVLNILSAGTQWLLNDGDEYYEMRVDGTNLDVYSVTSAAYSVLLTKAKTATGVTSIVIITSACHSILNTQLNLPAGMKKPDWFDTLVAHLDAAKTLAAEWINTLAPDLTALLPNKVINYDTTYNAITNQIRKIADANPLAKGPDDPNIKNVFALISALKDEVGSIHDDLVVEDGKLVEWGNRMQKAHDDLFNGVATIQAAEADLAADIGKMDADIARLNALIAGENKVIAAAAAAVGIGIFVAIVGVALAFATFGAGLVVAGIGVAAVIGGAVTWGIMQDKINKQYDQIAADQK
ncbi:MAG: alpha-pore-forming cytotoxin MakA, partial [Acidimicrobiia bacterium]